ncbi:MAG: pyrimidine 5'-nucleotidase [Parvibaculales bacterium]
MQNFQKIDSWVFDLDNTLYSLHYNLFAQVDVKMTRFIEKRLNVDYQQARYLQKLYLRDYGTTLAGLMHKHNIEPDAFLEFVHDIDVSVLPPDPDLRGAIAKLPGRKFIFTNGTAIHAERVASQLGLRDVFDDVFDIRAANYIPKPNAHIYPHMLAHFSLAPSRTAFFEDMARNLAPAHDLGMATILVQHVNAANELDKEAENKIGLKMPENHILPDYVHHHTPDLKQFLAAIIEAKAGNKKPPH